MILVKKDEGEKMNKNSLFAIKSIIGAIKSNNGILKNIVDTECDPNNNEYTHEMFDLIDENDRLLETMSFMVTLMSEKRKSDE